MPVDSTGANEDSSLKYGVWTKVTLSANGFPVIRVDAQGNATSTAFGGGAGPATLTDLALTNASYNENTAAGSFIGNILNTTGGSTLSLFDSAGNKVALAGNSLVVGSTNTDFGVTGSSFTITIRETLAGATNTPHDTVLTITVGNVNDSNPTAFTFTDVTNASTSTVYTSNTITIAGLETGDSCSASLSGDGSSQLQKNGGAWVSGPVTVVNGDTLAVRHTSSSSNSAAISTTLTVGTTSDTFTTTTIASGALLAPTVAFDTPTYLNPPNVIYTLASDAVMDDWIGREYANNAGFTGSTTEWHQVTSDEIINGSITWPFSGAFADGTLYIRAYAGRGTGPGSFTATSSPSAAVSRAVYDYLPNAWDFTDVTGATASTLTTSNVVTPTGYTGATPVVTNGNEVSINGGAFSTADTTISPGQTIQVRTTSSATAGASVTITINVAGVDVTFQVTTAVSGADFVPSTTQIGHMTSGYSGSADFVAGRQLVAILLDNTLASITGVTIGGSACTRLGGSTNGRWDLWELAAGTAGTKTVAVSGAGGDAVIMTGTVTGATGAGTGLTVKDYGFSVSPYSTPASVTCPANGVVVAFAAVNCSAHSFTAWVNGFTDKSAKLDATSYEGRIARKLSTGQPSMTYSSGTNGVAMFGIAYPG
jgi:hypothetical protein